MFCNISIKNVDTNYWILSMNILMSVCSAALLGVFMLIYFLVYSQNDLIPYAILGFMGAFLSNLITKENFLFVRGGPFWRYLFHNLMARPILGAFSATFIFWVEKSKLVFSINPITDGRVPPIQSTLININVNKDVLIYVYIVIAIVAGFAGEKLLRNMIDTVLKKLEARAAKNKETKAETPKPKETT